MTNIVYVAERNGAPILRSEISLEVLPTKEIAEARMEVTPIPRLETERVVPYISVEDIRRLLKESSALEPSGVLKNLEKLLEGVHPVTASDPNPNKVHRITSELKVRLMGIVTRHGKGLRVYGKREVPNPELSAWEEGTYDFQCLDGKSYSYVVKRHQPGILTRTRTA